MLKISVLIKNYTNYYYYSRLQFKFAFKLKIQRLQILFSIFVSHIDFHGVDFNKNSNMYYLF